MLHLYVVQTYCLEWYKNMEQKRALLDAAIDTFDGNCVMTVLLFIRKTLNHRESTWMCVYV